MKISLMFIKKGGGYPLTGGGFHSLIFNKPDTVFITKIINDLDLSDDSYHHMITAVIACPDAETHNMDRISKEKMRVQLMKNLCKELLRMTLNKSIAYENCLIYINEISRCERKRK